MGDWVYGYYQPAFLLTGDARYLDRMRELLDDPLIRSSNRTGAIVSSRSSFRRITRSWWPTGWQNSGAAAGTTSSTGSGWTRMATPGTSTNRTTTSVLDMAVALVQGYEVTGERRYLDSAVEFVTHLIPNYGFHTGSLGKALAITGTEYNPSGEGHPTMDATDNIQALVAAAVAMVGYYQRDPC